MNDTPRYRSFKRAYGGDPDTAVLHDLHKRVMRLEIDLANARALIRRLNDVRIELVMAAPESINVMRSERVGGDETPPPPKDQVG